MIDFDNGAQPGDDATRRAIVVRGGWDIHQPVRCTDLFTGFLRESGFDVVISDTLDVYADPHAMSGTHLIVQCWSSGVLGEEQMAGLLGAVSRGTGFAGWHGGVIATFAEAYDYHYMVGGQFVCHPGGFVDYDVSPVPDRRDAPIMAGIEAFSMHSEQYFCHVDPANDVLATTTFTGAHGAPETAGVVMPVVWTRRHGAGRVFISTLGHFPEELQLPAVRTLTERGLLWAAAPA
jgi:type 1 glutamine amidotransferase